MYQIKPDSKMPVIFKDNLGKKVDIIDFKTGFDSVICLSSEQKVYVWGYRMGVYP